MIKKTRDPTNFELDIEHPFELLSSSDVRLVESQSSPPSPPTFFSFFEMSDLEARDRFAALTGGLSPETFAFLFFTLVVVLLSSTKSFASQSSIAKAWRAAH